jgi:hypothetical protein
MKMKSLGLVLLSMIVGDSCIHAARKPSKVGSAPVRKESNESQEKLRQLLTEIAGANIAQVKMLLEDESIKKVLNEHDGTFSPLGKVDQELEMNKRSSLAKNEKMARGKALTKIRQLLEEYGATMVFRSADTAEPIKKKRAASASSRAKKA